MEPTEQRLIYPLDRKPEPGEVIEIAPGIRWLRLPMPFQLNHINVWLLRDDDGWVVVDTGLFTRTTREVWEHVLDEGMGGEPVSRVLVTHLHPDHVGCAGWLTERFGVDLWMSRNEYLLCRVLVTDGGPPAPREGLDFYHAAGFDSDALAAYSERFGMFGRVVAPLPLAYHRLYDGLALDIGGHHWEVVIGRGHSPEHACLLCRELNLLIAGDQLLPTISSNVSVFPTEPAANPLRDWFESIDKLENVLPPDILVLPAHGKPFVGAHLRLEQLRGEHEQGLSKLRELCREPSRAVDVFPALFKSRISANNLIMATGEAIAHLHFLAGHGDMTVSRDDDGVDWYETPGSGIRGSE